MASIDELRDKIACLEIGLEKRLAAIEEHLKHVPTKTEIADMVAQKIAPDWAGRTKFVAAIIGSGGLGAALLKIAEMLSGG